MTPYTLDNQGYDRRSGRLNKQAHKEEWCIITDCFRKRVLPEDELYNAQCNGPFICWFHRCSYEV